MDKISLTCEQGRQLDKLQGTVLKTDYLIFNYFMHKITQTVHKFLCHQPVESAACREAQLIMCLEEQKIQSQL